MKNTRRLIAETLPNLVRLCSVSVIEQEFFIFLLFFIMQKISFPVPTAKNSAISVIEHL